MSNLLERDGRKVLYNTLIHISLHQACIIVLSIITDLLILGLRVFVDLSALNMNGKEIKLNGL